MGLRDRSGASLLDRSVSVTRSLVPSRRNGETCSASAMGLLPPPETQASRGLYGPGGRCPHGICTRLFWCRGRGAAAVAWGGVVPVL